MAEIPDSTNELASDVIAAAIAVHRELGPGFREKIYSRALALELDSRDISFEREFKYSVVYRKREIGKGSVDFVIDGTLIVELKAVKRLASEHKAQVISYLKATGNHVGLLLNFSRKTLKDGIKRVVYTKHASEE